MVTHHSQVQLEALQVTLAGGLTLVNEHVATATTVVAEGVVVLVAWTEITATGTVETRRRMAGVTVR